MDEQYEKQLDVLKEGLPESVTSNLIRVLQQIPSTSTRQSLVKAFYNIKKNSSTGFYYNMIKGCTKDSYTPIREIIDLLEGWISTAIVSSVGERVRWDVIPLMKGK